MKTKMQIEIISATTTTMMMSIVVALVAMVALLGLSGEHQGRIAAKPVSSTNFQTGLAR